MSPEPTPPAPKEKRKRRVSPLWALGWLLVVSGLYLFRTDATYAFTVWPAWVWIPLGLFLSFFARRRRTALLSAYAVFAISFVDEAKSYPRMLLPEPAHDLRVVTLNCAGGTVAAAEEVMAQKPDIIFLEESPGREEVGKLAQKFFGSEGQVVPGPDATIIARGKLTSHSDKYTNDFVAANWEDGKGHSLNLVALRLMPPTMRIDLFNPDAWNEFAKNREFRRKEVVVMAEALRAKNFVPDLVGGDFNTPPDPGVLGPLTAGLQDTFGRVGVSYGATCVNPNPCLVRIDQIWCNAKLRPTRARVVATENSDHRMLVADFQWY